MNERLQDKETFSQRRVRGLVTGQPPVQDEVGPGKPP
jgi:hypothetical protein